MFCVLRSVEKAGSFTYGEYSCAFRLTSELVDLQARNANPCALLGKARCSPEDSPKENEERIVFLVLFWWSIGDSYPSVRTVLRSPSFSAAHAMA